MGRKKKAGRVLVLCQRTTDIVPVPGCRQVPCSRCGKPVWVSPATEKAVADRDPAYTCLVCCEGLVAEAKARGEPTTWMAPTEGQRAELRAHLPLADHASIDVVMPGEAEWRRRRMGPEILKELLRRRRRTN